MDILFIIALRLIKLFVSNGKNLIRRTRNLYRYDVINAEFYENENRIT